MLSRPAASSCVRSMQRVAKVAGALAGRPPAGRWSGRGFATRAVPAFAADGSRSLQGIASCQPLGDGNPIPSLGLGTWRAKPGEVKAAVKAAIAAGYRHIDCAPVYQNQEEVGAAMAECIREGIVRRDQLFVTTKLWNTDHAAKDVQPALETSLRQLGVEYLDLFLVHWPVAHRHAGEGAFYPMTPQGNPDVVNVPLAETWSAMEAAVDAGLVRSVGVSNFGVRDLQEVLAAARLPVATNQVEYHPMIAPIQRGLKEFCASRKIPLTAYSPLGGLTRTTPKGPEGLMWHPAVTAVAERVGRTAAQVLVRWSLQRGNIVIPKSSSPERVVANARVFDFELDEAAMAQLDTAGSPPKRTLNPAIFRAKKGEPFFRDEL